MSDRGFRASRSTLQVQDAETKAARIKVLTALRDDLAATTGPSDTLDCRISEVVFGEFRTSHFTASIDAAVTLVADWMEYQISTLYGVASFECPMNAGEAPWNFVVRRKDDNTILAICQWRVEYELAAIAEREA